MFYHFVSLTKVSSASYFTKSTLLQGNFQLFIYIGFIFSLHLSTLYMSIVHSHTNSVKYISRTQYMIYSSLSWDLQCKRFGDKYVCVARVSWFRAADGQSLQMWCGLEWAVLQERVICQEFSLSSVPLLFCGGRLGGSENAKHQIVISYRLDCSLLNIVSLVLPAVCLLHI